MFDQEKRSQRRGAPVSSERGGTHRKEIMKPFFVSPACSHASDATVPPSWIRRFIAVPGSLVCVVRLVVR